MSIVHQLRLKLNYNLFNVQPIKTIKQVLGQNTKLISYKLNSVVNWSNEVYVDVEYSSIPINPFQIYFIKVNEIKHLIPNSDKYVCEVNGCQVKLTKPKLNEFKTYLPIKINKTLINNTDAYDNLYTQLNDEDTSLQQLKTNITTPATYFGSTVIQPLNALCTPLTLLQQDIETTQSFPSFNLPLPTKLYPDSYTPKQKPISLDTCLTNYKQCLSNAKLLTNVENIIIFDPQKHKDIFNSTQTISTPYSTTAYLISISQFPSNLSFINGIILFQPKRIYDMCLFYPTNAYTITSEEFESIKQFVEFDKINYYNFNYCKEN